MAEIPEHDEAMFPRLDDAQIARLRAFGELRSTAAGEILFDQGDADRGVFVVLEGSIEIIGMAKGVETVLAAHGTGVFTGEVNLLSGRRSLVRCRVREAGTVLEISRANLRHLMQTDAALGEIFLRAFLLRRVYLIANSVGDAVLIGSNNSGDTLRLRAFLTRIGHPHTYLDVERDPDIQIRVRPFRNWRGRHPGADLPGHAGAAKSQQRRSRGMLRVECRNRRDQRVRPDCGGRRAQAGWPRRSMAPQRD